MVQAKLHSTYMTVLQTIVKIVAVIEKSDNHPLLQMYIDAGYVFVGSNGLQYNIDGNCYRPSNQKLATELSKEQVAYTRHVPDIDIVNEELPYEVKIFFTHGVHTITGTVIHILAHIEYAKKHEGYTGFEMNEALTQELEAAEERRRDQSRGLDEVTIRPLSEIPERDRVRNLQFEGRWRKPRERWLEENALKRAKEIQPLIGGNIKELADSGAHMGYPPRLHEKAASMTLEEFSQTLAPVLHNEKYKEMVDLHTTHQTYTLQVECVRGEDWGPHYHPFQLMQRLVDNPFISDVYLVRKD